MELVYEKAGWFGLVILLLAFAAHLLGWLPVGRPMHLASIAASVLLTINGIHDGAIPWAILTSAWVLISVIAFACDWRKPIAVPWLAVCASESGERRDLEDGEHRR